MSVRLLGCIPFSIVAVMGIAGEPSHAPLYTDEDLARVSPFRDQTGVASIPAVTPSQDEADSHLRAEHESRARADSESYWRREAQRHRSRQAALVRRIRSVARQLDGARRRKSAQDPRSSSRRGDPIRSLEDRLATLEEERRDEDSAFEDRARRAGALPGWLRE
jgi:hypothetical protein